MSAMQGARSDSFEGAARRALERDCRVTLTDAEWRCQGERLIAFVQLLREWDRNAQQTGLGATIGGYQ